MFNRSPDDIEEAFTDIDGATLTKITFALGDSVEYRNAKKQLHRIGGPAMELRNCRWLWFQNDLLHREDGPAVYGQGEPEYWIRGVCKTEIVFALTFGKLDIGGIVDLIKTKTEQIFAKQENKEAIITGLIDRGMNMDKIKELLNAADLMRNV